MNILFFVSIAIIFGLIVSKFIGRLKLPGVVGYLIIGLILGPSVLNVFKFSLLEQLDIFTSVTLSFVAFIIGSELKMSTLKSMGRGITVITLLESFGAFLVVATGVYLLTKKVHYALVLGALAPASAPAGTVAVLEESKAKGRLTSTIYAVVGLDDGLAVMIFAVFLAVAKLSFTGESISVVSVLAGPMIEILGSILLGAIVGILTGYFIRRFFRSESLLAVTVGAILLCAGVAEHFGFSLILANLTLGLVFVNVFPVENKKSYSRIKSISLPIYIIFFFVAGAHLQLGLLPSIGLLGLIYIVCRIIGLMGGAYLGGVISKQSPIIRNYLGFGILSQAGVAIGLAVLAGRDFEFLGEQGMKFAGVVVTIIAASTIVFEIIGPIGAKFAVTRAGEAGLNVTEEDLIELYQVKDVMDSEPPVISSGSSLQEIIDIVSRTDRFYYPVLDEDKTLAGVITLDGIRKTFNSQEINQWLVALDIMEPVGETITADMPLSEAFAQARRFGVEHLAITERAAGEKFLGVLDCVAVHRGLSAELLERQRKAERG